MQALPLLLLLLWLAFQPTTDPLLLLPASPLTRFLLVWCWVWIWLWQRIVKLMLLFFLFFFLASRFLCGLFCLSSQSLFEAFLSPKNFPVCFFDFFLSSICLISITLAVRSRFSSCVDVEVVVIGGTSGTKYGFLPFFLSSSKIFSLAIRCSEWARRSVSNLCLLLNPSCLKSLHSPLHHL